MTKQTEGGEILRSAQKESLLILEMLARRGRKRNWRSQPELTAILRTLLGFCLFATTSAEGEDIALSRSSLRRILLEVGINSVRKRRL